MEHNHCTILFLIICIIIIVRIIKMQIILYWDHPFFQFYNYCHYSNSVEVPRILYHVNVMSSLNKYYNCIYGVNPILRIFSSMQIHRLHNNGILHSAHSYNAIPTLHGTKFRDICENVICVFPTTSLSCRNFQKQSCQLCEYRKREKFHWAKFSWYSHYMDFPGNTSWCKARVLICYA